MKETTYDKISELIGKTMKVKIDREMGSRHPKWGFIYPINYGFIEGIIASDGEELDAYVLGVFEPVKEFEGECIAIIRRTDDDDDKLIIVPKGKKYSDEAILALTEFQERFFRPKILRK